MLRRPTPCRTPLTDSHFLLLNKSSAVAEMGDRSLFCVGGGLGYQTNTMWPGPRPTSIYQVAS